MDWQSVHAVFTDLASLASIVGLVLTLFVFREVRRLKGSYILAIRSGELVQRLRSHGGTLITYLDDFARSRDLIPAEIAQIEATLQNLSSKASQPQRKTINQVMRITRKYDISTGGRDDLRTIYSGVMRIAQEIEDVQEDVKWQR